MILLLILLLLLLLLLLLHIPLNPDVRNSHIFGVFKPIRALGVKPARPNVRFWARGKFSRCQQGPMKTDAAFAASFAWILLG